MALVEGLRLIHRKNELVEQAQDGTLTDKGREELFEALKGCREWLGIEAEKLAERNWQSPVSCSTESRDRLTAVLSSSGT
ncbi:MAG: hypothetical protein ACYSW8_33175 [Planctomycetota bacterium]|jgi:hypothetical protein